MKKTLKELDSQYKQWLNEDVVYIISPEERNAFLQLGYQRRARAVHRAVLAAPQQQSRSAGERFQGRALPPHRLRQRALSPPAFPAGRPTAAASTSCGARRTKSNRIPPAAPTTGPWKKAAVRRPPIPGKPGAIAIWKASGKTSILEFVDPSGSGEYHMTMDPSRKRRAAARARRRLELDGIDGHGLEDRPLHAHRRHEPADSPGRNARQHERVQPPGTVRQGAASRPRSNSRIWKRW